MTAKHLLNEDNGEAGEGDEGQEEGDIKNNALTREPDHEGSKDPNGKAS